MMHKDAKGVGSLDYTDFSKWMGSSIEPSAGFYFRHDSIKNPQYERNLENHEKKLLLLTFINKFIEKVQFQWKTLKKAFTDLNSGKGGSIMHSELKYYLNHWGFYLNDEQYQSLFEKLDVDKDGKISYKDFQNSVGKEITPTEFLYFRQDLRQQKPIRCAYKSCWETTIGIGSYCALHTRIIYNKAFEWMTSLPEKLKDKWETFFFKNLRKI